MALLLSVYIHEWIRINNPPARPAHTPTQCIQPEPISNAHSVGADNLSLSLTHKHAHTLTTYTRPTALCAAEVTRCHLI